MFRDGPINKRHIPGPNTPRGSSVEAQAIGLSRGDTRTSQAQGR